jgi:hypothetical protein
MGIAVIAGLTFATFLTLVLVPVLYSLLDDLDAFVAQHFKPSRELEDEQADRELEESLTGEYPLPEPAGI